MPILNGVKVACEPCIRGHRSTKCTHATERLMVPVRKPGRPLSACPHPPQHPCNCGHITAAIPRKQTCRCPDDIPTHTSEPVDDGSFAGDLPSPTRGTYRVQKSSSRLQSSRKISMDSVATLERMAMSNINFDFKDSRQNSIVVGGVSKPPWAGIDAPRQPDLPWLQAYQASIPKQVVLPDGSSIPRSRDIPEIATIVNRRTCANGNVIYLGNGGKPLTLAEKVVGYTKEGKPIPPLHELGFIFPGTDMPLDLANDDSYALYLRDAQHKALVDTHQHAVALPVQPFTASTQAMAIENFIREDQQFPQPIFPAQTTPVGNGVNSVKSCCAPKKESHSHSSSSASSISEPQELQPNGEAKYFTPTIAPQNGHGTKPDVFSEVPKQAMRPQTSEPEIISMNRSITTTNGQGSMFGHPGSYNPINNMASPVSYSQNTPSSVFTYRYPASYGSFQNPFTPETWRQNLQPTGSMAQQPNANANAMPPASFARPITQDKSETIHECCCGDGCECLGCAAHPYNNTTQEYVRSAWAYEASPKNDFTSSPIAGSGLYGQQHTPVSEEAAGPQPILSPTSSANGDEYLSNADFFFVDYPVGDGCGGDTVSCPCGDDCACFGCTIHKPDPELQNKRAAGVSSCCS